MTPSQKFPSVLTFVVLVIILTAITGCAPTGKLQSYRTSFLPPAPRFEVQPNDDMMIAPPTSELYVRENPNTLPPAITAPRNTDIESRMHRSDEAFFAGQRAYQRGDMAEARREFNRAIDILLATPDTVADRPRLEKRLEQLTESIFRYDVNGMGAGEDPERVVYDRSPLDEIREMTFPVDPRLKAKVKDEIAATSSQLPLEFNDSVLSSINFFSSERGKKILIAGTRRSGRYKPMIQRVLSEEGVPQELIYLAQIESGFYPRAISVKSCVGMWQFASFRGREYGLSQSREIDERMDPEKSTRAAARHLHDLYNQFGDWYLAMAAYNCGPACVDRAVQRTGYADFWRLRDIGALPKETTNYVPVIIAITVMMKNARDYGLENIEMEPALEYDSVRVDVPTNIGLIADAVEQPVTSIRDLNPALIRGVAPAGYEVRVPKGTAPLLASLENIPAERRANWRMHKVNAGETVAGIAKRYGASPTAILAANSLDSDGPSAGDLLMVPAANTEKPFKMVSSSKRKSSSRASVSRKSGSTRVASSRQPAGGKKVTASRKPAPKAVYAKTPQRRVLNRKATVKTAALR